MSRETNYEETQYIRGELFILRMLTDSPEVIKGKIEAALDEAERRQNAKYNSTRPRRMEY